MKNIIIAGPPRAGKSTLARRINRELGHSIIPMDAFVQTFKRTMPKLEIGKAGNGDELDARKLSPFLAHFVQHFAGWYSQGAKLVLEGVYIDYEHFFTEIDVAEYTLIGLSYNKLSAEEIFRNVRKHDGKYDWTFHETDDEMRENAEVFVTENARHYEKLTKHGFAVYDVSAERETVFAKIMEDIKRE